MYILEIKYIHNMLGSFTTSNKSFLEMYILEIRYIHNMLGRLALACFRHSLGITFQLLLNCFVWLRITDEG